jgi:type IV pilus assembly protein PilO
MAAFIDKIQKIPTKTRAMAFGAFIAVLISLFIWQVHIPKQTEIKDLDAAIAGLQAKIRANDEKIRMLDELRAEVKSLQARLVVLTEQLPPESEVSGLLRQIQRLVNQSGLSLKVWRPAQRRRHPSDLYEEIPISLQIVGGYHNVALFFDRVGKMTRIVNVLNVNMGGAKMVRAGEMEISINCTAMTFAAVEKKAEAPAQATKKVK